MNKCGHHACDGVCVPVESRRAVLCRRLATYLKEERQRRRTRGDLSLYLPKERCVDARHAATQTHAEVLTDEGGVHLCAFIVWGLAHVLDADVCV
jgi:hypothetical protein